jgi:hypothetical protein
MILFKDLKADNKLNLKRHPAMQTYPVAIGMNTSFISITTIISLASFSLTIILLIDLYGDIYENNLKFSFSAIIF